MSLATDGMMSKRWQNSAARRRAHARFRAHLVRLLGWTPEEMIFASRYAETTDELLKMAREARSGR
ncbi:MAG: hypothetical protein PVSMB8_00340 [Vulcanimicrobiaceae bacterium]